MLEKRWFFHEIFPVGACPNLKDSSLYERYSIHMYKARSNLYLQQFSSICDSLMPCTVHFFGKRWFFMKYFNLVHAPTWKIPYYITGFTSICTRQKSIRYLQQFSSICDSLMPCTVYILGKKMVFYEIFQVCACPNLFRFLIIWQVLYSYVQGNKHTVSPTIFLYLRLSYALYSTFFGKKMIFHEIFQVGACPNLKDSLLYDKFSIHMYKAWNIRYFQHFSSICDSLMPSKVHFFLEKDEFLMKYFKMVHVPTWKIP